MIAEIFSTLQFSDSGVNWHAPRHWASTKGWLLGIYIMINGKDLKNCTDIKLLKKAIVCAQTSFYSNSGERGGAAERWWVGGEQMAAWVYEWRDDILSSKNVVNTLWNILLQYLAESSKRQTYYTEQDSETQGVKAAAQM